MLVHSSNTFDDDDDDFAAFLETDEETETGLLSVKRLKVEESSGFVDEIQESVSVIEVRQSSGKLSKKGKCSSHPGFFAKMCVNCATKAEEDTDPGVAIPYVHKCTCSETVMTEAECYGVEGDGGELGRKEKRKMLKKMKRKEKRKDVALMEKLDEEMTLNDPEEQKRIEALEREEMERVERQIKEFEERERLWMEKMIMKHKEQEEADARRRIEDEKDPQVEDENLDSDTFEYVEGPAEIIWQGNEIIVKKKKVQVPKKKAEHTDKEEAKRPTSNPFPPQGESYTDSLAAPVFSAQQAFDNLAQQVPSFGTEQDKAHCPFHIKTGVCRFGSRCNRAHFYPDKSCTLLMKNMYSGPGLAWEQDEALEHTEEEVERSFEEFYEDVHTEFLKFGEIINFKVCRNGSAHLRGNVYVHYKMLDSALLAYRSINGRYFAGKQVKCEYVGVTRWKIAICGEYMKTRLTTCSRGTACNFIHCFRNPGGDYEWADWDKPPPKYWVKKMSALFGCMDDSIDEFKARDPNQLSDKNSQRTTTPDANRYHHYSRRCRSRDKYSSSHASHRDHYKKIGHGCDDTRQKHKHEGRRDSKDTLERDCLDTMMLSNNSKELSLARKSSNRQIRDDEVCEAVAEDRDRSNNELQSETRCSWESNRSRHCNKKHNDRMKDESTENGGLGVDQVKSSCCTNWDKGRDDEEEKDRDDGRDREMKRMGRDSHGDSKEIEHGHQNKRRRRSAERENSMYSPQDYGDKKKTYSPAASIHSDEDEGLASNNPMYRQCEAVGFIDRWDPSLQ